MNTQTIQKLKVENIKGIKHIEIVANDVNEICGENGAGKSSILDSIAFAFGGKKIIDKKTLRDGEKNGVINIETNDLIISRKFNDSGTTLTVKGKNGGKYAQKDLNGIFSMISFDPLEFSRAGVDEQVNIVKGILGDEFNASMNMLKTIKSNVYDERTEIGRQGKAIGDVSLPEKVERVDVSKLMADLEAIEAENKLAQEYNKETASAKGNVVSIKEHIQSLKDQMSELKELYKDALEALSGFEEVETGRVHKDVRDDYVVREKIKNASAINDQAARYDTAMKSSEQKEVLKKQYQAKSDEIRQCEVDIELVMQDTNLPVEGLMIGDEGVTLDGIPIGQISSAEKLMLSTKIACSINSDLKIIMIKDGSLLDTKSFELIKEYSKTNGYQLWIETVGDGKSQDSIKISDGEISND